MSKRVYLVILFVLIIIIAICSINILYHKKVQGDFNKIIKISSDKYSKDYDIDYYKNLYHNKDIKALLEFGNTKTLVTQTDNNEYYLNHLLDNNKNILGTPFIDYRTKITDKKIIIYGHNAKRYSTPFKNLEKYLKKEYYEKNKYIKIKIDNEFKYEIFSVALYNSNFDYYKLNIRDWQKHFDEIKNNSLYDTGVNIDASDDIIILQTCSNNLSGSYIVISGKKIKE